MDMLKKFFPLSFGAADVKALVIKIAIYVIGGYVLGFVAGLLPLVGGIIGTVISLYSTVGWILAILDYLKVLKQDNKPCRSFGPALFVLNWDLQSR